MISFWISLVPPKIAITGVGSVDSRVSRGVLAVHLHEKTLAGDRVAVQGSLARSLAGKRVSSGRNGREPFQHSDRYDTKVERPYPCRSDDGAVSLQESRGDPR